MHPCLTPCTGVRRLTGVSRVDALELLEVRAVHDGKFRKEFGTTKPVGATLRVKRFGDYNAVK